ncbi:hypothetical protein PPIS_b0682 [Pseudoalteromonas piscicida]|uniref:Uncharacterized protein n=1 Tax=Pseudoalteromonas piscicida TaxID=43662 RepID=A0ABN5CJY1_PSEO7|nr:hypothetical protein PPIS_b0682 [Pseudoalteromonas piscicida]
MKPIAKAKADLSSFIIYPKFSFTCCNFKMKFLGILLVTRIKTNVCD